MWYKERQSFRTSFPSASLFSVVHLVSITVASLTHGFSVMLVRREKKAKRWKGCNLYQLWWILLNSKRNPTFWRKTLSANCNHNLDGTSLTSVLEKTNHLAQGRRLAAGWTRGPPAWRQQVASRSTGCLEAWQFGLTFWLPDYLGDSHKLVRLSRPSCVVLERPPNLSGPRLFSLWKDNVLFSVQDCII